MDKQLNTTAIVELYKKSQEEIEHLKRKVAILEEENETYRTMYGENYVPAMEYKNVLKEMMDARDKFLEKRDEFNEMSRSFKEEMELFLGRK